MSDSPSPLAGYVPGQHQLDAYGRGGFRFAGMSHVGSILALPSGIGAWHPTNARALTPSDFDAVFTSEPAVEFLIVGTGNDLFPMPESIRARFRAAGISLDQMQTGAAARTYNVLVAEGRRAGAALIAVDR
jgi:uncharacterized protein